MIDALVVLGEPEVLEERVLGLVDEQVRIRGHVPFPGFALENREEGSRLQKGALMIFSQTSEEILGL